MLAILAPTVLSTLLAGCVGDEGAVPAESDLLQIATSLATPFAGEEKLANATVMVDNALGDRAMLITNAQGKANMPVDWDYGPFDITIDPGIDEQPLVSILGIDQAQRHVQWTWQQPIDVQDTVVVAGVVKHHDPDTTLNILAYGAGNAAYVGQPIFNVYALRLLPDEPFQILALDMDEERTGDRLHRTMSRWTLLSHDGVSSDTRLDIDLGPVFDDDGFDWDFRVRDPSDMTEPNGVPGQEIDHTWFDADGFEFVDLPLIADPLEPTMGSGVVRLPDDHDDVLYNGATADVTVTCTVEGIAQACGWATSTHLDATRARYAYFSQHVVPSITEKLETRFVASKGENGSVLTRIGAPGTWESPSQFLPVPDMAASDAMDAGMQHWAFVMNHESVDGVRYGLTLEDASGKVLWTVRGTEDRVIELPAPPTSVDVAELRDMVQAVRPWLSTGEGTGVTAESWSQPHVLRSP